MSLAGIMLISGTSMTFAEGNIQNNFTVINKNDNFRYTNQNGANIFKVVENKNLRASDVTGIEFFGSGWRAINYPKKYSENTKYPHLPSKIYEVCYCMG